LFDNFDDEEFKKRFSLTKSTVTKLLEQVGIPADCAASQNFLFYRYLYILHYYYNISVPASVYNHINDVANYAIGLGQGHASL